MSHRKGTQSRNLAYFSTRQKFLFTEFFRSLEGVAPMRRVYVVTSDDNAPAAAKSLTAPARKWAAYRFDAYRAGMSPLALVEPPDISVSALPQSLELVAVTGLPAECNVASPLRPRLSLTAVIEDDSGRLCYWAARHPAGRILYGRS